MPNQTGRWLFRADDGNTGTELWITDGTTAGTYLLKDINPGVGWSSPDGFAALGNGLVLFQADDGTTGTELWITDGTAAGTQLLKDIRLGTGSSSPSQFTALGNGLVLFQANDGASGFELWVTDGTAAGTQLLKDIRSGTGSSSPTQFTALGNGQALFTANDGTTGLELWVTDGTAAGTQLLKDIRSGTGSSVPSQFTALGNGQVLFTASDATHGTELWITDGTTAGTQLLKDINSGNSSSAPLEFTALGNGQWVFRTSDGVNGYELWITDGSAAGTQLLKDIRPGASSSSPTGFTALGNGQLLFRANDGTAGSELWITDGTAAGTQLLKDIVAGTGSSSPSDFATLGNGLVLFVATDDTNGYELWVTDGTAAGTQMLKDINTGPNSSVPTYFTALGNGQAIFQAQDGPTGVELWITDGTVAGTQRLKDIYPGTEDSFPSVFFRLPSPNEPPVLDGTPAILPNGTEDQTYTLNAAALLQGYSDPDGDTLQVGGLLASQGSLTDNGDGTWTFTPPADYSGTVTITYIVSDGNGGSVSAALQLVLDPVNDAPTLANALVDQNATEDAVFSFQVPANAFADVDAGDTLAYSATLADGSPLPAWLGFDPGTRTFTGTPTNGDVGTLSLKVTATDSTGALVSDTFDLVIANTNDAPTLANAIADQNATEDAAFSFTFAADTFADVDLGDTLTYTATLADGSPLPTWLAFDPGTRTFSGTPTNGDVGTLSLKVTTTDSAGALVSDTFDLVITNTNDAPTLAHAIADQNATEDATFSFTFAADTFADVDLGDTLSYTATLVGGAALPAWLSFDAATRTFSGMPSNDDVGTLSITVTATDSAGAQVSDTFDLAIANVNDPAVIGGTLNGTLAEDAVSNSIEGTLTISDVDSPATFQAVTTPTTSDQGYGTFTVTASGIWTYVLNNSHPAVDALATGQQLTDSFTVVAADGTTQSIAITIDGNTDVTGLPPTDIRWTGSPPANGALPQGGEVLGTLATTDPDSSAFTYALLAGSSAGFSINNGVVSRASALTASTTYQLIVQTTDDSGLSYTETFVIRTGTGGNNTLNGGGSDDVIYGAAGNDTVNGSSGDDSLFGGLGDDILSGGIGDDTLHYTLGEGNDTLRGDAGNDRLLVTGSGATDSLTVLVNTSGLIYQLAGSTVATIEEIHLDLGADVDTLSYAGTTTAVSVNLSTGSATGFSSISGIENVTGGDGADVLTGDANANVLFGGAGADTIDFGLGNDDVKDRAVYSDANEGGNGEVIRDFDSTGTVAQIDSIDLTGALRTLLDSDGSGTLGFRASATSNNSNTAANLASFEALYLPGTANDGVSTANLTSAAAVAAEFNAEFNLTVTGGEQTLLLLNDNTAGSHQAALWLYTEATAGTSLNNPISAAELTLIGVIEANAAVLMSQIALT